MRIARGPHPAGEGRHVEDIADDQAATAEQEVLAAERHMALREALTGLPPCCQQVISLLTKDIGPTRARCLDKLRRHPAIAALLNADAHTAA